MNLTKRQEELLREFEKQGGNNSPENQDFFSKVKDFWEKMRG